MSLQFWLLILTTLMLQPVWAKDVTVHVLYWSMKIEGQVMMRKGFEEVIADHNAKQANKIKIVPYIAGEGQVGIHQQIRQLDQALKSSPDYIVIQPTDTSALIRGLKEANRLGIPVFTYDQFILQGKIDSFITSDNYQAGWDNGKFIDQSLAKGKELKVVLFEYPNVSSTIERVDGFFDALREQGRSFRILKRYKAIDPESGKKAAQLFLHDFPEKASVDVIFTVNDGAGLEIVKALAKNRKEILHVTVDGDPQSIENIKESRLTVANSAQYCAELGRETARQLIKEVFSQKSDFSIRIPTFLVTKSTLSHYPGWGGVPAAIAAKPPIEKESGPLLRVRSLFKSSLTVKIGVASHCPYICEIRPGVWSGYVYDILNEVAKKHKFNLDFRSVPNSRLVGELINRQFDFIIIPGYLVRYRSDVRIKGPRLGMTYTAALVRKKDNLDYISQEDLAKKGVVFADLGQESDLDIEVTPKRLLRINGPDVAVRMKSMVQDKRVDIALGDQNILAYALQDQLGDDLELKPTSFTGINPIVLVSSPKNPDFGKLSEFLTAWMADAQASGKLQKILKSYNVQDWTQVSGKSY